MARWMLLATLCCPLWAAAQAVIDVESHHFLRLPAQGSTLQLERLEIADSGTLMIPAGLRELRIERLYLGRDAQIAIAPAAEAFRLEVGGGSIAAGAQISAPGAPGSAERPALPGRTLSIRLQAVTTEQLAVDARGGRGAPGYAGLDGADGKSAGCTWGQAGGGHDGQDGGDGQPGAPGGQVRLEVPADFPTERLQVRLEGGPGGLPGRAGNAGQGGASKGCWIYSTGAGRDGLPGRPGQAGVAGATGRLDVVRF